jgi:hypothetical protein
LVNSQNASHYGFEVPVIFAEIRKLRQGFKITKKQTKQKQKNQTTKNKITKKNKQKQTPNHKTTNTLALCV